MTDVLTPEERAAIVLIRAIRLYRDSGPEVPDWMPITVDLKRLADDHTLTLGHLRRLCDACERLAQENTQLRREIAAPQERNAVLAGYPSRNYAGSGQEGEAE